MQLQEPSNLQFSDTVDVPQSAVNRQGGRCPCRGALAFSYHSKQKRKSESFTELCERPDCMFRVNSVV